IVSANEQSSTAVSESEKIENKPVETLDTYELTSDAKVSEVTTDVESDKKTEAVTAAPEENKQTNDIRTNEQSTSDNVEKQAAEEQEIETKE
ncbi:UNVERIFIED_CONTAM: hypothetical protein ODX26_01660, partial [Salmonella enterica subsp. enterica serovar Meleagridis]